MRGTLWIALACIGLLVAGSSPPGQAREPDRDLLSPDALLAAGPAAAAQRLADTLRASGIEDGIAWRYRLAGGTPIVEEVPVDVEALTASLGAFAQAPLEAEATGAGHVKAVGLYASAPVFTGPAQDLPTGGTAYTSVALRLGDGLAIADAWWPTLRANAPVAARFADAHVAGEITYAIVSVRLCDIACHTTVVPVLTLDGTGSLQVVAGAKEEVPPARTQVDRCQEIVERWSLDVAALLDYCAGIDTGDHDGLTDELERALAATGYPVQSFLADTDDDGLTDALEAFHLTEPVSLRPFDLGGTDVFRELRCGSVPVSRPTFQPAGAGARELVSDPFSPDTDRDGVIDGLEDANFNGVMDDALALDDADMDDDKLADGLEIRVFGAYRYCNVALNTDAEVFRFTRLADLETDPNDPDTDDDGLIDGIDVNPNGLHPPAIGWKLAEFKLYDGSDPDYFQGRSLEPFVKLDVRSPIGRFIGQTPVAGSDIAFTGWEDASALVKPSLSGPSIPWAGSGSAGLVQKAAFNTWVWFILTNDIAKWTTDVDVASGRILIDIDARVYDWDGDLTASDLIDLDPARGNSEIDLFRADVARPSPCGDRDAGPSILVDATKANGLWDTGSSGSLNGGLTGRFVDTVNGAFVLQAAKAYASATTLLPDAGATPVLGDPGRCPSGTLAGLGGVG